MQIAIYFIWAALALAVFATVRRSHAVWFVLIGGWLFLPPAIYSPAEDPSILPYWIIGGALPSDHGVSKAWIAPAIATVCSIACDRARWKGLRLSPADAVLLLFCIWPSAQSLLIDAPSPSGLQSSAYLAGVWGLPWLIGKLYLRTPEDAGHFAGTMALLSLALLPLALIEGLTAWRLHSWLFGVHPFAYDGIARYAGFRPQALFEHGNQYGLWCAASTLCAGWRLREGGDSPKRQRAWAALAIVLAAMTLASQSIGAVALLLACGAMIVWPRAFAIARRVYPGLLAVALVIGALHVSGIVPLRTIAEATPAGQTVRHLFRVVGRQSLPWRVSQDLKALPIIQENLLVGSGKWDWFRPAASRPWGFPLLLLGQFGLVGFAGLAAAIILALARHLRKAAATAAAERLYVALLALFVIDGLLNSFLFYPAIVAAGAASARRTRCPYPSGPRGPEP